MTVSPVAHCQNSFTHVRGTHSPPARLHAIVSGIAPQPVSAGGVLSLLEQAATKPRINNAVVEASLRRFIGKFLSSTGGRVLAQHARTTRAQQGAVRFAITGDGPVNPSRKAVPIVAPNAISRFLSPVHARAGH